MLSFGDGTGGQRVLSVASGSAYGCVMIEDGQGAGWHQVGRSGGQVSAGVGSGIGPGHPVGRGQDGVEALPLEDGRVGGMGIVEKGSVAGAVAEAGRVVGGGSEVVGAEEGGGGTS